MAAKMARQSGSALGGSGYTPYGSAMPPPVQPEPTFVPAVAPPPPDLLRANHNREIGRPSALAIWRGVEEPVLVGAQRKWRL